MALESDRVSIVGGVRHGMTLGGPVSAIIENIEYGEKWSEEMNPESGSAKSRLTRPRPGHADLVGMLKYDFDDARNVLERASARETAARVVAGSVVKSFLMELGITVASHVIGIGKISYDPGEVSRESLNEVDEDRVRCIDRRISEEMAREIDAARADGDTVGGIFEVVAFGVPPGLGSYVHWDRRLDGMLAQAILSVNAVKGVEVGRAWSQAKERGRVAHDQIGVAEEKTGSAMVRSSNQAGGIEGGMSTGAPIVLRGAMKPLASLRPGLMTVDMDTGESAEAITQRTDTCAVPAAAVVSESMVAVVLASEVLRKFGGDSLEQVKEGVTAWGKKLETRLPQT